MLGVIGVRAQPTLHRLKDLYIVSKSNARYTRLLPSLPPETLHINLRLWAFQYHASTASPLSEAVASWNTTTEGRWLGLILVGCPADTSAVPARSPPKSFDVS